jgi:general L-amino acid transport system substrate-binding protein
MHISKVLLAAGAATLLSTAAFAGTLDDVRAKGFVQCGVSQGLPGFSNPDPLSAKERFTALQSGEIDVLSRNTTWTLVRDTSLGLNFAGVNYYDGQGFMVRKDLGVTSALELDGASVCVNIGTTTELNLSDYFRANNISFEPVVFEKADEVVAAYDSGRCDVYTTDQSGLAAQRIKLSDPEAHVLLPEVISKEPLGPVVSHGDDKWLDVVKWTLYAMVEAEELGVTSGNVDQMRDSSSNPGVKRLLGTEGDTGKSLGVSGDWAYNIVKQVGNYGESFDRYVGPNTALKLERGLNALWKDGGLQYPMPVR